MPLFYPQTRLWNRRGWLAVVLLAFLGMLYVWTKSMGVLFRWCFPATRLDRRLNG